MVPLRRFAATCSARLAVVLAACLSAALPQALRAAPAPGEAPAIDVAVIARSSGGAPDPALLDIVSLAARIGLEREGRASAILKSDDALRDAEGILAAPGALGAPYLLLVECSSGGGELALRLSWFDREGGRRVAEVERSGPMDMRLDGLVFEAVGELLGRVEALAPIKRRSSEVQPPAETAVEAASAEAASAGPTAVQGPAPEGVESSSNSHNESPSATEPAPTEPAATEPAATEPDASRRGLGLALAASPFLAGGSLADFFELAGCLALRASWTFEPLGRFSPSLGLFVEGVAFSADGPLGTAEGLLAPVALEAGLEFGTGKVRTRSRVAGGVALALMGTEAYGDKRGFLPFAQAGLGVEAALSPRLGLSIDLGYQIFVDGKDLIMGFSPGAGISARFGRTP